MGLSYKRLPDLSWTNKHTQFSVWSIVILASCHNRKIILSRLITLWNFYDSWGGSYAFVAAMFLWERDSCPFLLTTKGEKDLCIVCLYVLICFYILLFYVHINKAKYVCFYVVLYVKLRDVWIFAYMTCAWKYLYNIWSCYKLSYLLSTSILFRYILCTCLGGAKMFLSAHLCIK